jgi:hypothetical protein
MRERAAMLGGSLNAGPTEDGGFLVTAVLPTTTDGQGDAAISADGHSPARQGPDGRGPDGQGPGRLGDMP